jgi:hypothetical protein
MRKEFVFLAVLLFFCLNVSAGNSTICPSGCDYVNLSAWEAGEEGDLTGQGPSIAIITEGFVENGPVVIYGWTTTADDYIMITTNGSARANGVWNMSKYVLNYSADSALDVDAENVIVDGISILQGNTGIYYGGITVYTTPEVANIIVKNSIINGNGGRGYGVYFSDTGAGSVGLIYNVIAFNYSAGSSSAGFRASDSDWNVSIFNSVAANINPGRSFFGTATTVVKNCISADVNNDFVSDPFQEINYTISADTPIGGANSIITTDWDSVFVNMSIGDFRLKPGSLAVDAGTSIDSFSGDFVGVSRPVGSAWDIGAFEWNGNKGVIPEDAGSPFYVNSSVENNPTEIGVIAEGESQVVSWEVHVNDDEVGRTYSFFAFFDSLFDYVVSETVNLTVIIGDPWIWFVGPTPDNGSSQSEDYAYVNYSVDDRNEGGVYSFVNWNGSLIGWWRMDSNSSVGENGTHVYDWSGSGNNGSAVNASFDSEGSFGGMVSFDEGGGVVVGSALDMVSRSYRSYNGSSWNHIVVSNLTTYVNGVLRCGSDMAYIDKLGGYCIDRFEASMPSANSTDMGNSTEVALRNNPGGMAAQSVVGVVPWVSVSQVNARVACSNAGKHLCTSEEWLGAANLQGQVYDLPADLGNVPYGCVTTSYTYCLDQSYNDGEACNTGYNVSGPSGCYSAEGVFDMVGNVREWVNETVDYTKPCNVGSSGYCYWNGTGWDLSWDDGIYGNDGVYFQSGTNSGHVVARGDYWWGGESAGLFSTFLVADDPHYRTGFRCCS